MSQLLTMPYIFPAVLRDISERGRDLEQILSQYITFVKPAFEEFCLPVSKGSDTHRSLPEMPYTMASSSDRSILCPRAQVSLSHFHPSLLALAKIGVLVLAETRRDGDYLYRHCLPGKLTLPCGDACMAK